MHRFVLHNDEIHSAGDRVLMPGQVGLLAGWGVFSTLRVTAGLPFAYERHWERMRRDARAMHVPFPSDPQYIRSRLMRLIQANGAVEATLRVAVIRNRGGIWEGPTDRDFDLIALTADPKVWGQGVNLTVRSQARHAACGFRGVKILSWAINLTMLEEAQEAGFDEVILLNERGEVSECTSANIFLASGSQVWTPPLDSGCLPGVTRELLLEEVRVGGISVGEKALFPEDLERAGQVFITSTTRGLLPVLSIDHRPAGQAGEACLRLQEAFGRCVNAYVAQRGQNSLPAGIAN
jgi:branched-chain amino acid aminotransferase